MLEDVIRSHAVGMEAGGVGERVIPLQRRQGLGGALVIERVEELALRIVPWRLSAGGKSSGKQESSGQEKFEIPHGAENQPRTRTALKLRITWPPAVGRPKLSIGLKREKSSI